VIGSATIALTNKFKDAELLYNALNTLQGARYLAIYEANKSQEDFLRLGDKGVRERRAIL
jgi:hypothetical protein